MTTRMYTERCGVHGPTDELTMLRRELHRLGADIEDEVPQGGEEHSQLAVDTAPEGGDMLVQANQYTRIHGEPIATRLELQYEEMELHNALMRAEAWERRASAQADLMLSEEAERTHQASSEAALFLVMAAEQMREHAAVAARVARAAAVDRQRCAAEELLLHDRQVIDMDAKLLRDEYEWSKLVREEDEVYRKEAEVAMRYRMAAEKRALLPDHDLTTGMPFLLTTFERFLPYA